MKIHDELTADHFVAGKLEESDLRLLGLISNIPYFVRRYFVVELESPEESAFLEFYTRSGFGEMCEEHLIRIPLKCKDSIQRVLFCNFIPDGSVASGELMDFLVDYRDNTWHPIDASNEIDMYTSVFGANAENSAIKLMSFEALKSSEFLDFDEDAEKTLAEIKSEDEKRRKIELESYLQSTKAAYESVDVSFLDG